MGRDRFSKLLAGSTVLLAAYLLKSFYSQAGAEDLTWIIGPTAWLTEVFSGLSFTREAGYGWVNYSHNVVIAPVCAGVNFLIIAFCMASFLVLKKKAASAKKLIIGILIAALTSYVLTITANTARIILSVILYDLDIYSNWLTPALLHRISGVAIYFMFLSIYYHVSWFYLSDKANPSPPLLSVPLLWYVLISIGVPLANKAYQKNTELFITHVSIVLVVASMLSLGSYIIGRVNTSDNNV